MKVIMAGSRNWRDTDPVVRLLEFLYARSIGAGAGAAPERLELIHGAGRGVDQIVHTWALRSIGKGMAVTVSRYPAQWQQFGNRAGPLRNQKMVGENSDADLCVGLKTGPISRGTDNCLKFAREAHIPTWEIVAGQPPPPPPQARLITDVIRHLLA